MRLPLFFIVLFTICLLAPRLCFAQPTTIKGQILEPPLNNPLPFVHITVNDGEQHVYSDIEGNFTINSRRPIKKLEFWYYLYREQIYYPTAADTIPLKMEIHQNEFYGFENKSTPEGEELFRKVIKNKKINNPHRLKSYEYITYNKLTVSTDNPEKINSFLEKLTQNYSIHIDPLKKNQHFFLLETVTKREYLSPLKNKETVIGAKSSGINVPSLFLQSAQVNAFSIYDNSIKVGGSTYLGPLAANANKKYAYTIIDTAYTENDTIYTLKFNSRKIKNNVRTVKGFLFISSKNYGVRYYLAAPATDNKIRTNACGSYEYEDGKWIPSRTQTVAMLDKIGSKELLLVAIQKTYVSDVRSNPKLKDKKFDEIVLEYKSSADGKKEDFWAQYRKEPETESDRNTYTYFDSLDRKKRLAKFLTAGEKIVYGQVPYKFINIDLNRVHTFNPLEGARLGFGAHTNNKFSNKFVLGGYAGYGLRDKKAKYGADVSVVLQRSKNIKYNAAASDDIAEAGALKSSFDKFQYPSEALRKYRLRVQDYVKSIENSITAHPFKYMDVSLSLSIAHTTPSYAYEYKNTYTQFNFTEFGAGFRYAFGEQFVKLPNNKTSLGTKYPVLYFQFFKGVKDVLWGDFNYNKWNIKVEETIKTLFGKSGVQLIAGITTGDAPYFKLYNCKGNLRQPSAITHNGFETMKYNEFLADKFFAAFFSHNFGKIYFKNTSFRPDLTIVHNMGVGYLSNPQYNTGIAFKTMQKGYYESGFLLDDLVVVNLIGLRTGIGSGLFMRYGPYAVANAYDNLVLKLALNFLVQ